MSKKASLSLKLKSNYHEIMHMFNLSVPVPLIYYFPDGNKVRHFKLICRTIKYYITITSMMHSTKHSQSSDVRFGIKATNLQSINRFCDHLRSVSWQKLQSSRFMFYLRNAIGWTARRRQHVYSHQRSILVVDSKRQLMLWVHHSMSIQLATVTSCLRKVILIIMSLHFYYLYAQHRLYCQVIIVLL